MKKNYFLWFGMIAVAVYLYTSSPVNNTSGADTINLVTTKTEVTQGNGVVLEIANNTDSTWTYEDECPSEPFDFYKYEAGSWQQVEAKNEILLCDTENKSFAITSGEKMKIDYSPWVLDLMFEKGRYQVRANFKDSTGNIKEFISNDFNVVDPSFLTSLWRGLLYRPFYNLLIFLTKYLPYHSLGLAIIALTLIIRIALLLPSQKAMKAQKAMQEIQPKLQHIKEKYKGDQQRIAQETMRIWREHKVNPMGSCLPMLVQFPVLIALFYVVREGLNPNNIYLLYESLKGFDLNLIQSNFFGILDLTKANLYVLPLIVGFLQFAQMKLAMGKNKPPKETKVKNTGEPDLAAVNNMMIYMMPVLIAVFTASLPAGVGLYWAVSTLFGIGQQIVVNNSPVQKNSKSESDGEVRVKVVN